MKRKWFMCAVSVLLCLTLGIGAVPPAGAQEASPEQVGITEETDAEYIAAYTPVCENSRLALYADMDKGWFALQNKQTGKLWYSTPNDSALDETTAGSSRLDVRSDYVLEYQDINVTGETTKLTFNTHEQAVREDAVQVELTADGLNVTYTMDAYGIVLPVSYILREDSLEVRVHVSRLEETENFVITSLRVLPNFGAGGVRTDGWMLIPDGSGAIASFNNGRYTAGGYDEPVYGPEYAETEEQGNTSVKQPIRLPVFGIGQGEDALFGIITEGESAAHLRAEFSGDSFGYNTLSSTLNLRTVSTIGLNSQRATRISDRDYGLSDYTVRYYCLSGEDAGYVGMAKTYRNYLIAEQGLSKTAQQPALNLECYGAIDVQANFLGIPYKKLKALTTFAQAGAMAEELTQLGAGTLALRYEGWTEGGVMNRKLPQSAKPLSVLGGSKQFTALAEKLAGMGAQLYPDTDLLRFRKAGNGVRRGRDSIKNPFGEVVEQYDYMLSVYAPKLAGNNYYLLRANAVETAAEKFLRNYQKLGVSGVCFGTAGDLFYADTKRGGGLSRTALADAYTALWDGAKEYATAAAGGNAQTAVRVDKIFAAPLSSSGHTVFDRDVPFYSIVFHGYTALTTTPLNQVADSRRLFLNAVETGSELLYGAIAEDAAQLVDTAYSELYSTTFALWKEQAVAYDQEYRPLLEAVAGQAIVDHTQLGEHLYKTTYENHVTVYVNYADTAQQADGITIGGMDFEAVGI